MSAEDSKIPPPDSPPPGEPQQRSGRVAYDARGNPTWEWRTATGVFGREVSPEQLQKLEAKLSLEDTQPIMKSSGLSLQEAERLPCGGVNPYDTDGRATGNAPVAAHPAQVRKPESGKTVISNSLVSKYAAAKKDAPVQPQNFWQKLMARFKSQQ